MWFEFDGLPDVVYVRVYATTSNGFNRDPNSSRNASSRKVARHIRADNNIVDASNSRGASNSRNEEQKGR
jgi:hypothetical protein